MLLDKIIRHLYQKAPGSDDEYMIVYPRVFLDDIYTDFKLEEKFQVELDKVQEKADQIHIIVEEGVAPVTSITGKTGEIHLDKGDIKLLPDGEEGLDNVDNTSDLEKPISKEFKEYADKVIDEGVSATGKHLVEETSSFRYHVSGNSGSPIQGNPHNLNLSEITLPDGSSITLDPGKFTSILDVESALKKHNEDPTSHEEILKFIDENGELFQKIDEVQQETNKIISELRDRVENAGLSDEIKDHNEDPTAHQVLLDEIQSETDRLQEVRTGTEDPLYEYTKYKVQDVNDSSNPEKDYPSVWATFLGVESLGSSLSVTDPAKVPYLQFGTDEKTNQIKLILPDGEHLIDVPMFMEDSAFKPAYLGVWYYWYMTPEQTGDLANNPEQQAVIGLPESALFCWRDFHSYDWSRFRINYGIIKRAYLMSYAGYTEDILTEEECKAIGYDMTGVHFYKYGAVVYTNPHMYDPKTYNKIDVADNIILGELLCSDTQETDSTRRVLWIDPLPYEDGWKTRQSCHMTSFDLDGKKISETNVGYEEKGPVDIHASFDTHGEHMWNQMVHSFKGMSNAFAGLTFNEIQIKKAPECNANLHVRPEKDCSVSFYFGGIGEMKMHSLAYNPNIHA